MLASRSVFPAPSPRPRGDSGRHPRRPGTEAAPPSPGRLPGLCTPRRRCAPPHRAGGAFPDGSFHFQPASAGQSRCLQEADLRLSLHLQVAAGAGRRLLFTTVSALRESGARSQVTAGGARTPRGRMVRWRVAVFCLWVSCGFAAGQLEYSALEETKRGVTVGNVAADLKLSAATLSLRNFRFRSSHSESYFGVYLSSGGLVVREPADRERLCKAKGACVLINELVLEDPLELHKVRVRVLGTNDNSPLFLAGDVQLHIAEFLMPGARFTLPNAQDADEGSNGALSYCLSPSQHFHLDVGSHIDGSEYLELVLQKALDREQRATHRLVLTARDGGQPARSGDAQVTIFVVDTNDNAPVFERTVYRTKVPETTPNGTVLF